MYERLQPKVLTGKIWVVWIAGRLWEAVAHGACLYQHNRCFAVSHSCAKNYHAVEERMHEISHLLTL